MRLPSDAQGAEAPGAASEEGPTRRGRVTSDAAAAKRTKAARLAEHIRALAAAHHVVVDEQPGARGRAWRHRREIRVAPVRGVTSYFVALHELGHLVGRGRSGRRLEQETTAWRWALDEAIVPPTPGVRRAIFRRLWSYVTWARARQHRAHSRPVIPPPEHPLWGLLEQVAPSDADREAAHQARTEAGR